MVTWNHYQASNLGIPAINIKTHKKNNPRSSLMRYHFVGDD